MSTSVELLDRLETELAIVQDDAAARAANLAELLIRTGAHWKAWSERWQAVLRMLAERGRELDSQANAANGIVTVAETKLQETEAALREWLATAQVAARQAERF